MSLSWTRGAHEPPATEVGAKSGRTRASPPVAPASNCVRRATPSAGSSSVLPLAVKRREPVREKAGDQGLSVFQFGCTSHWTHECWEDDPTFSPRVPKGAVPGDVSKQVFCSACHEPKCFYVDEARTCVPIDRDARGLDTHVWTLTVWTLTLTAMNLRCRLACVLLTKNILDNR